MASQLVRLCTRLHRKRVICWSYSGKQYSCNPKSLTEYFLREHPGEFEIYWVLKKSADRSHIPADIKIVHPHTWRYIIAINTSKYIITNARTGILSHSWLKRRHQVYVMTWHSSMGIKKVEKDAINKLHPKYVKSCRRDSRWCNLIFSGCRFRSEVIRRAFWYDGEILEHGTPRNDLLFDTDKHASICHDIREKYDIGPDCGIVLYAPTFRRDGSTSCYTMNWTQVTETLERTFGKRFQLLVRMHPNLIGKITDITATIHAPQAIDVTPYHDMHELLIASDILITDYSSSIFDMALLQRPVFILATDYSTYDRGTYFRLHELPYPFAENEQDFVANIQRFDSEAYRTENKNFLTQTLGTFERGEACKSFYEWMINKDKR